MRMVPAVQAVNVVVTCTQAKRVAPAVHAGTGAIDLALPASERVEAWAAALEQGGQAVEARNLYSGDHWSVSCGMHRPPEVSVWVASAGYGLVGVDAPLCPYAATFRLGEEDSVCASSSESGRWWDLLAERLAPPDPSAPRSLEALVAADPGAGLLLVASPSYLSAMARDFSAAQTHLARPDSAMVIAAGADRGGFPLADAAIRFDARIRALVGGGMQGLNARVARFVVEGLRGAEMERGRAQELIDQACSGLPPFEYPQREGQVDEQVLAFIREALSTRAKCTKTGLLREWRASGKACEQKRFGALFESVKASHHAQN